VRPVFAANDPRIIDATAPPRHCHAFPVRVWRDGDKHKKVPKIPAGCDWRTYDASADAMRRARNFGVVIPDGVVILDLDVYKGVTREAVDKQLACTLEWDRALLQTTVSGGEHFALRLLQWSGLRDSLLDSRDPGAKRHDWRSCPVKFRKRGSVPSSPVFSCRYFLL